MSREKLRRGVSIAWLMGSFWVAVAPAVGAGVHAQSGPETVALQGGRLLTVTNGVMENGTLVMRNGRIAAIGESVSVPQDARVVDVSGMTVTPGLLDGFTNLGAADYPSLGRDDDEATDPVTPHLRITDAFNPENRFLSLALSSGVTAALCAPADGNLLAGQSAVVRLVGETVEEMVVRFPVGVHGALGEAPKMRYGERNRMPQTRMGSAALLRQTFVRVQEYGEKLARHQQRMEAWDREDEGTEPEPPERDPKLEALLPVLRGETPFIVSADRFDDLHTVLRIAGEFDIPLILNHGAEAHRVARELAEGGIPVVWGPGNAAFRELESRKGDSGTPMALADAGVPFAFQTGSVENVTGLLAEARLAVRHGLAPEEALRALTLYPARMFGVADELGALEVGKAADVVVFSGNPLEESGRVEMVFVGGERIREPGP